MPLHQSWSSTPAAANSWSDRYSTNLRSKPASAVVARYGDTAQLAAVILEEGRRTPADVFFAQDAGALGALTAAGRLQLLARRTARQSRPAPSFTGRILGRCFRACPVIAYNTRHRCRRTRCPPDIWDLTEQQWRGRIGWAPTNGSFQAFVTALRVLEGDDRAEQWLRGIIANRPRVYPNNRAIVDAVGRGEIHVGLVNHYYLFQYLAQQGEQFPVRNHYTTGDAGAIINIAGVGVLDRSEQQGRCAEASSSFCCPTKLSNISPTTTTSTRCSRRAASPPIRCYCRLADIKTPDIDLTNLHDLQGTLELLQKVGAL